VLAGAALVVGVVAGSAGHSRSLETARSFADAWERSDHAAMYKLLTPAARRRTSARAFRAAYRSAAATSTLRRVRVLGVREADGGTRIDTAATTRAFGTIRRSMLLPETEGLIDWRPHLTFPGVAPGARLARQARAPERAAILARDGTGIARGPASAREVPGGFVTASIAGTVGSAVAQAERDSLARRGFPVTAPIGTSGLERVLEEKLAGTPGGLLFAGGRVLASTEPQRARDVRTTIDLRLQEVALTALAGRFGGVAALDPSDGKVRALAGIAFSGPQPPGSTFKIITTAAALESKLVKPSTPFPVQTKAVIDGVDLENANGESCGGTFANSFAHSCNSVFAPLGVRLGAKRLVAWAERFGFNKPAPLSGAMRSTLPSASDITSPLEVGSTAIGQGRVLATPLQLASMAQVVANDGVLVRPSVIGSERPKRTRVMSRRTARQLERLMIGVVQFGTGIRASLAPTKVAGKTGTAELEDTTKKDDQPPPGTEGQPVEAHPPGYNTDAWFTAYAPSRRPRLAVAVLLVRNGAGGDTAAPVARAVLQAALEVPGRLNPLP
jgi:cell division protein FtsI/penicillin-binding protein 2